MRVDGVLNLNPRKQAIALNTGMCEINLDPLSNPNIGWSSFDYDSLVRQQEAFAEVRKQAKEQDRQSEDEEGNEYHIALGYSDYIDAFAYNIEQYYRPDGVYYWQQWDESMLFPDGRSLIPPGMVDSNFPAAFFMASRDNRVSTIQFNVEGMEYDYESLHYIVINYPKDDSGQCDWSAHADFEWSITAWELCAVVNSPDLLLKTRFYREGSSYPPLPFPFG